MRKTWYRLPFLLLSLGVFGAGLIEGAGADAGNAFPHAQHEAWKEECGACHLAFAPGMLPARSWRLMMAELQDHFGTDATLDSPLQQAITEFLVANAADNPKATVAMQRLARSVDVAEAPLRITETTMFRYFHDEISDGIWGREKIGTPSNCPACHTRAEEGSYAEWEIRIPKD